MKQYILLAFSISFFTLTNAQKMKTTPVQKPAKTFIVNAATAKDLPSGITFINNKITLKSGYKFEQLPNNGGVNVVNAKAIITGTFECGCSGGATASCTMTILGNTLYCQGGTCCRFITTVDSPKISDMQMKQN